MPQSTVPPGLFLPPTRQLSTLEQLEAARLALGLSEREMVVARALIANLEQQCRDAERHAATYRAELEAERRANRILRRRVAQSETQFATIAHTTWSTRLSPPRSEAAPIPQASNTPTVELRAL